jgi:hypothetical protein
MADEVQFCTGKGWAIVGLLVVIIIVLIVYVATDGFKDTMVASPPGAGGPCDAFSDPTDRESCRAAMKAWERAKTAPGPATGAPALLEAMREMQKITPAAVRAAVDKALPPGVACFPGDKTKFDEAYSRSAAVALEAFKFTAWAKAVADQFPECSPETAKMYQTAAEKGLKQAMQGVAASACGKVDKGGTSGGSPGPRPSAHPDYIYRPMNQQPAGRGIQEESQMK